MRGLSTGSRKKTIIFLRISMNNSNNNNKKIPEGCCTQSAERKGLSIKILYPSKLLSFEKKSKLRYPQINTI
jgi:hypothetical protein